MTPRERYSLALALLPHAGRSPVQYLTQRHALLALLEPEGGPVAVAVATGLSPKAARATIQELLAFEAPAEVAA